MGKITRINITVIIILVLFFFVPGVYGLRLDVSSENGGSSSSFNHDFNLANDASVDGNIVIDKSGVHPTMTIKEPSKKLDYGDWNAKWWKWALSMPTDKHPLFDTADINEGQKGNVWFLGSSFVSELSDGKYVTTVNRDGEVPAGTMLFFPIFNVEASTIEGTDRSELKDTAQSYAQYITEMSATIDGVTVTMDDLKDHYRAESPVFEIKNLPENNVLQYLSNGNYNAPEGTHGKSAADGYYLMLSPLSPGDHTISWTSTLNIPGENPLVFEQDVDYGITVEPKSNRC